MASLQARSDFSKGQDDGATVVMTTQIQTQQQPLLSRVFPTSPVFADLRKVTFPLLFNVAHSAIRSFRIRF